MQIRIDAGGGDIRVVGEVVGEVEAVAGRELGRRDRQPSLARADIEEVPERIGIGGLHVRVCVEIGASIERERGDASIPPGRSARAG
jgi:hypothetical protein